jgi:hypothetical protein
VILVIGVTITGILVAVVAYGKVRWNVESKKVRNRLEIAKVFTHPNTYNEIQLEGLPEPVQRYFRTVLSNGQRIVSAVSINQRGTFDMGKNSVAWKSFTATQRVVTYRPGFDWDARIAMMPGIPVHVHDAYVSGEGILHAAILGLIPVADFHGTGETARGELIRYFAEAAGYPTALLPSQGVTWEAINSHSARATLSDGEIKLELIFQFNEEGLIDTVSAEERGQLVDEKVVMAPWRARVWDYEIQEGMKVPMRGEASWVTNEGPKPYWRGQITSLQYEFAP